MVPRHAPSRATYLPRHVPDDAEQAGHLTAGAGAPAVVTGSGRKAARHPSFKWVNTTLGNIKSAIVGPFRNVSSQHSVCTLAEFEYRCNRRYDRAAMMPRLGTVAVRTLPMPYRLLRLADEDSG